MVSALARVRGVRGDACEDRGERDLRGHACRTRAAARRAHALRLPACTCCTSTSTSCPALPRSLAPAGRFGLLSFAAPTTWAARRPRRRRSLDRVETALGFRPAGPVRLLTQVRSLGLRVQPGELLLLLRRRRRHARGRGRRDHQHALGRAPRLRRCPPAPDGVARQPSTRRSTSRPFFADGAALPLAPRHVPGERLAVAMVNSRRRTPRCSGHARARRDGLLAGRAAAGRAPAAAHGLEGPRRPSTCRPSASG